MIVYMISGFSATVVIGTPLAHVPTAEVSSVIVKVSAAIP